MCQGQGGKPNCHSCESEGRSQYYTMFKQSEQNVHFADENESEFYSFPPSSKDFATDSAPEDMGDFLSRPLLIKTISWVPAGVSDADWDPWTLFFNNSVVKHKINNFAYIRGNLHVKFVINASPFIYGLMRMAYTPTPDYVHHVDELSSTSLATYSQRPGIWLDLRENAGGEMILPFIWPRNFVDITNASAVANLGRIRNINYVGLRSANGTTTKPVTIKVYAWMEDVVLTGNTYKLAMQSKKSKDEYGNGPISRPANALAHWASYLVNVPVIGTYARATQIAASATSSVAGLFGWTKVPVIENVKPVKLSQFHGFASSTISQPTEKLTYDPKAELSVDPRVVGPHTGEDELMLSNIISRESYLTSIIWTSADVDTTSLQRFCVTPSLKIIGSTANNTNRIGHTPMSYIAEMFSQWRGDIIFTIRVVCSAYHKGRLRLSWDPLSNSVADITQTSLTKIIDIGDTTEFEFRVPYVKDTMWTNTNITPTADLFGVGPSLDPTFHNGMFTIVVSSQLSAPTDSTSVNVLVSVKGAENLEFANPRSIHQDYYHLYMQSDKSVVQTRNDGNVKQGVLDDRYLINYGEPITSLRTVLHRAALYEVVPAAKAYGNQPTHDLMVYTHRHARFPGPKGYDGVSYTLATGVVDNQASYRFKYAYMTPLAWITPMFVARRGSIQWHYQLSDCTNAVRAFRVSRDPRAAIAVGSHYQQFLASSYIPDQAVNSSSQIAKFVLDSHYTENGGISICDNLITGSISVECPAMSPMRYYLTKPALGSTGYNEDQSANEIYKVEFEAEPTAGSLATINLFKYVNAGTDFSLTYFLCAPQMSYCTTAGATPAPP